MARRLKVEEYVEGILGRDIAILSRAISLVESHRAEDRALAQQLLLALLPYTGKSKRIGITGSPGVGKSTFIEHWGQLIAQEASLAVLTVDPSSPISKGSILGDKTRMYELSQKENVYIRTTASKNALGGIAEATYDTLLLCEAAGFEVLLIESVGVGQTETLVYQLVDCFILLILGNSGDELQGIKKGIMEMADIIVITKADEKNRHLALQSKTDFQNALRFFQHPLEKWKVPIEICSALEQYNLDKIWTLAQNYFHFITQNHYLEKLRTHKRKTWFDYELERTIVRLIKDLPAFQEFVQSIESQIERNEILHYDALNQVSAWLRAHALR